MHLSLNQNLTNSSEISEVSLFWSHFFSFKSVFIFYVVDEYCAMSFFYDEFRRFLVICRLSNVQFPKKNQLQLTLHNMMKIVRKH
jgi:hypothetical protein